ASDARAPSRRGPAGGGAALGPGGAPGGGAGRGAGGSPPPGGAPRGGRAPAPAPRGGGGAAAARTPLRWGRRSSARPWGGGCGCRAMTFARGSRTATMLAAIATGLYFDDADSPSLDAGGGVRQRRARERRRQLHARHHQRRERLPVLHVDAGRDGYGDPAHGD